MTVISFGRTNGIDVPNIPTLSINTPLVSSTGVIKANNLDGLQTDTAPIYGARAWVNFNGVTTATIRASGNVSSVTRNAAGDYTVNFATPLSDANYTLMAAGPGTLIGIGWAAIICLNTNDSAGTPTLKTANSCRISTFDPYSASPANRDYPNIGIAFIR